MCRLAFAVGPSPARGFEGRSQVYFDRSFLRSEADCYKSLVVSRKGTCMVSWMTSPLIGSLRVEIVGTRGELNLGNLPQHAAVPSHLPRIDGYFREGIDCTIKKPAS